ncbi:hypothetical protein NMY22_g7692 [Coprinellus aureogranulatus]|nr:hypothetical protein NMY22_g7692 [Coprinellus aureogranulatus]
MATSSEATNTCPILVGPENYQIWRIRIEAKLQMEKSSITTSGDAGEAASGLSVLTSTAFPDDKELREWNIANAKARGIIVNYVSDEIAIEVHGQASQDTKAIFNYIVAKFESTNAGSTAFGAFLELIELKWDESADFASHTGKFLAITAKLNALKHPISDLFKVYLFLRSLPNTPTWQVFTTAYINSSGKPEDMKISNVMSRAASQVANNVSLANSSQQSQHAYQATTKKCLYHKTGGHSTDECWQAKKLLEEAAASRSGSGTNGEKEEKKKPRYRARKRKESAKAADASGGGDGDPGGGSDSDSEYAHVVYLPAESKRRIEAYVAAHSREEARNTSFFDSATSSTMTPNSHWLLPGSIKPLSKPVEVHLGDDSVIEGTARGTMRIRARRGSRPHTDIHNVLLVPRLASTLISIPALTKAGYNVLFTSKDAKVTKQNQPYQTPSLLAKLDRGMYRLSGYVDTNEFSKAFVAHTTTLSQGSTIDILTLHRRMGHASEQRLHKMVREGKLEGITSVTGKLGVCEACALGKMKKLKFCSPARRETTRPFELVHTDVGGPVTPQDPSGFRYWITFINDFTRYPWVFYMRKKEEAPSIIRMFYSDVEGYFKSRISKFRIGEGYETLRSDGGGEYVGASIETFLRSKGIAHERSAPYTPEQNGLAERMNQSLRNSATAMLIDSRLPKTYWTEAMSMAAHIIGRTPASGIGGEIPFERMFNRKVDPSKFRPFGCTGYALIPKQFRDGKFGDNARKCILLGYESQQKAYRLLDIATKKIITSRHVAFDEDMPNSVTTDANDGDWGESFWHQRPSSYTLDPKSPTQDVPREDDQELENTSEAVGAHLDPAPDQHHPPHEPQPALTAQLSTRPCTQPCAGLHGQRDLESLGLYMSNVASNFLSQVGYRSSDRWVYAISVKGRRSLRIQNSRAIDHPKI